METVLDFLRQPLPIESELLVVAAIVWAVPIASFPLRLVMSVVPQNPERERESEAARARGEPEIWHRTAFGMIERAVIVTGVAIGSPEVVAGWLIFKAAMSWGKWPSQIGTFNRFAIGTGLSFAYAASGGALIASRPIMVGEVLGLIVGPLALSGLIALMYWWEWFGLLVGVEEEVFDRRRREREREPAAPSRH